jgi:hypothetical protein
MYFLRNESILRKIQLFLGQNEKNNFLVQLLKNKFNLQKMGSNSDAINLFVSYTTPTPYINKREEKHLNKCYKFNSISHHFCVQLIFKLRH